MFTCVRTNKVSISNHQSYIPKRNAKRCIGQRNRSNALFPRGIPGINSSVSVSVLEKKKKRKEKKKGRKEKGKRERERTIRTTRSPSNLSPRIANRNIASITFAVVIYVDKRKIPPSRPFHRVHTFVWIAPKIRFVNTVTQ